MGGSLLSLLICLSMLTPSAFPQTAGRRQKPQPRHLYKIGTRDEKKGEQRTGFIDRTGRLVVGFDRIPAKALVGEFSEGLAAVAVVQGGDAKYGFINKEGKMVIAPRFEPDFGNHKVIEYLSRFAEGLARVKVGEHRYGYIDKNGDFAIPPRFHDAADFSEGLASVTTENDETGYIDKNGRMVIQLKNAGGYSFSEGLAAVAFRTERGEKLGYIDRTGRVIIRPTFYRASAFKGGLAEVEMEQTSVDDSGRAPKISWGYIDKTGRYVWESH